MSTMRAATRAMPPTISGNSITRKEFFSRSWIAKAKRPSTTQVQSACDDITLARDGSMLPMVLMALRLFRKMPSQSENSVSAISTSGQARNAAPWNCTVRYG